MRRGIGLRCLFLVLVLFPAAARVRFGGLDLSDDNRLLFLAGSRGRAGNQNALFLSRLADLSLQQFTAFPEKMELVEGGRTIQIRNAFGLLRVPLAGGLPRSISGFSSFTAGGPVPEGRIEEIAVSPDGRWLLRVEGVSAAYGNLVLIETASGTKRLVAENAERPGRRFPACWSPDSRVFVYCRGSKLYYYSVNPLSGLDERRRLIGGGNVNSVAWGNGGEFFYLRGSILYRVRSSELFTRALYGDFLDIGSVAGKIPFDFDPGFDQFWTAPDSSALIFSRGGRNVFYFPLDRDDYRPETEAALAGTVLPYVMIPRSCFGLDVLWSSSGLVTVIAPVVRKEGETILAWRLAVKRDGREMAFESLESLPFGEAVLSPDGARVLFRGGKGAVIYDYAGWKPAGTLSSRPTYSCLWINSGEVVLGNDRWIERVRLDGTAGEDAGGFSGTGNTGRRSLVCLSGASEAGFEAAGPAPARILAKSGDLWFASDGEGPWIETANPSLRKASQVSDRFRVYLERLDTGPYENLPMVRNTASVGTFPAIQALRQQWEDLPAGAVSGGTADRLPAAAGGASGPLSGREGERGGVFYHGRREGLREAALCFDLYDDAGGLSMTLEILRRYSLRATFFLNGEFIRRYPGAAKDIAEAGHETASMFFAPVDLSDVRYRTDRDFVTRGLARNEDEYHRATGGELGLLWHPPWYAVSPEIAAAARAAGYRTIGRDLDPLDWIGRDEARHLGMVLYSASDIIDRIMQEKRPGSIIPVRLGMLPGGGRGDYLFLRLEVLLDALLRAGYDVVPVSTIIEHTR
ncbi:MAG: polysaccharide deacetylase family protein [Treponema sp.]|jgi:peptidoglycan/xylan/chitin deacetylase (PgdA/CDA1 family)|nr:polysaccharide deacetylase family protein [Treponema sp.]